MALALALKVHRAVLQALKLDLAPKLDLKPMVLDLKLAPKLDLKPMVLKADLEVKVMDLVAKVLLVALQALNKVMDLNLKLPLLHMDLDLDLKVVPTLLDLKPMVQAQAQAQALKPMVPVPVPVPLVRQIMDLEVRVLQVALQALKVMDLNQEVKVVVLNPMVLVL